jgi:hypothetical protein
MSCILSKGIALDCTTNTGGVQAVWIAPISSLTYLTVDEVNGAPSANDGKVVSIQTDANLSSPSVTGTLNTSSVGQPLVFTFVGDVTPIYTTGTSVYFEYTSGPSTGSYGTTVATATYNSGTNATTVTLAGTSPGVGSQSRNLYYGKPFYKFEFIRNGATFEQPATISLETGSTFYTQTLSLTIPKQDVNKRNAIYQLAKTGAKFLIIVKDMNSQYWLGGVSADSSLNNAFQVSTANAVTGKAKVDLNGYEITLTSELNAMAYQISEANAERVSTLYWNGGFI